MQYGSYYWPALCNNAETTGNVTATGFVVTIVLMAIFTAINFLAMRMFARVNSGITWWKVAIPVLAIIVLLFKFHPGNFSAGRRLHARTAIKALFGAHPLARHHLRLPRASSRPTSWPARSRTRSGTCRGRSSSRS